MRFVVIGAGAIGGVVGGRLLEHGHEVAFVARGAHGRAMAEDGLRLTSPEGARQLNVDVVAEPKALRFTPSDVVLLSVKSQDTIAALEQLATATELDLPIVCLQNGTHNEHEALRRFSRVYGATVMCPAVHLIPGEVRAHSSPVTGLIDVGRYPDGSDDIARSVVQALAKSTFSSEVRPDIMRWKWGKLLLNLGNVIEVVCRPAARRGPIGNQLRQEGESVLEAAGIDFASSTEDKARRADLLRVGPAEGERRPGGSSWQSVARGMPTVETDYLNGEIILLGRVHGLPTPINDALRRFAREIMAGEISPGSVSEDEVLVAAAATSVPPGHSTERSSA